MRSSGCRPHIVTLRTRCVTSLASPAKLDVLRPSSAPRTAATAPPATTPRPLAFWSVGPGTGATYASQPTECTAATAVPSPGSPARLCAQTAALASPSTRRQPRSALRVSAARHALLCEQGVALTEDAGRGRPGTGRVPRVRSWPFLQRHGAHSLPRLRPGLRVVEAGAFDCGTRVVVWRVTRATQGSLGAVGCTVRVRLASFHSRDEPLRRRVMLDASCRPRARLRVWPARREPSRTKPARRVVGPCRSGTN